MSTTHDHRDGASASDGGGSRRIVYLTADWPWPPTSGGRLQATHLADAMRATHDVTVLAADRTDDRFPAWSRAVEAIRARRASQPRRAVDALAALAAGRQVLLQRMLRAGGPAALAEVLDRVRPALVVLGRPFFDGFIDVVAERRLPLVIEANEDLLRASRSIARHGATPRARLVATVDSLVVGRQQRRNYPRADQLLVCSPIEARILAGATGAKRVAVVPNVVPAMSDKPPPDDIHALAFLGAYGYAPNEAAAIELMDEILPRVADLGGPGAAVLIGRDPTPRMTSTAAVHPGARVTGEVPDVVAELRAAGLLVVPIRSGAGTRVKILEAAAAGIPIVSTPFGAEGLDLRDGAELLIGDTPDEIAAAVMRLHADADLRRRIGAAARSAVADRYSIEAGRRAVDAAIAPLLMTSVQPDAVAGASRLAGEPPTGGQNR